MNDHQVLIASLPKLHKDLSPNARIHWAVKAKIVKSTRYSAYLSFRSLRVQYKIPDSYEKATIKRVFYFKDKRRRDSDNFDAMTKSVTDGMRDSGLLKDDDQITWLPTEFIVDKDTRPRLEYHLYDLS